MRRHYIHVTTSFVATHCWPDADPHGPFAFLAHPHRHHFHVDAWIEVKHDDRELEFFAVQHFINQWLPHEENMGSRSCEQVASEILDRLLAQHGKDRRVEVEVSEDGENGALAEWEPDKSLDHLYGAPLKEADPSVGTVKKDDIAQAYSVPASKNWPNVLEEANEIVDGERQAKYGHPLDNFEHTAGLLNSYFNLEYKFTAEDVAYIQIMLKLSRQRNFPLRDNLVDIAGYSRTVEKVQDERLIRADDPSRTR